MKRLDFCLIRISRRKEYGWHFFAYIQTLLSAKLYGLDKKNVKKIM